MWYRLHRGNAHSLVAHGSNIASQQRLVSFLVLFDLFLAVGEGALRGRLLLLLLVLRRWGVLSCQVRQVRVIGVRGLDQGVVWIDCIERGVPYKLQTQ